MNSEKCNKHSDTILFWFFCLKKPLNHYALHEGCSKFRSEFINFSLRVDWNYLFFDIASSEESATISYRLGLGMVPDDEDSRDFDDGNDSSLQPVTDLAGVGDDLPSNDVEGLSSQPTTDISSVLEQDSNQEVHN